jgi:hypothetical protein
MPSPVGRQTTGGGGESPEVDAVLATSRPVRQIEPMGGDHRARLSERGRRLAALAEQRMGDMPLEIDPTPLLVQVGVTRRQSFPELDPPVYVQVWLKVDDAYRATGSGNPDYYLAHELGHAIRIANRAEPEDVRKVNEEVYQLSNGEERERHLAQQPYEVRQLLYEEEVIAWDLAEELLEKVDHDPDHLRQLRATALEGYRDGLGIASPSPTSPSS